MKNIIITIAILLGVLIGLLASMPLAHAHASASNEFGGVRPYFLLR